MGVADDEESSVEKKYVAVAVAVADPIAPVEKKEIDVSVAVAVAVTDPIVIDTSTTNNDTTTVSSSTKRSSTSRKKKVKSKHEQELKPTVVKTDKRNKDRHETEKTLVVIENDELVSSTSFPTSDGLGEDEWQTVAKSKGDKKGKTVTPVNLGKNNSDSLGGKLDDNVSNTEETKEKRVEKANVN